MITRKNSSVNRKKSNVFTDCIDLENAEELSDQKLKDGLYNLVEKHAKSLHKVSLDEFEIMDAADYLTGRFHSYVGSCFLIDQNKRLKNSVRRLRQKNR